MTTIVTRAGKGAPLTNTEVDNNFTNLNTDKVETSAVGTIAAQNANNVSITGGSVTGITDLAVADGGTGRSTLTSKNILIGAGTSAVAFLAPGAADTVIKSDGTDWIAGSAFPSQTGNAGTALVTDGSTASWGSTVNLESAATVAGLSSATFDIPSWVNHVTVVLDNVSLTGTGFACIRLGTSSGIIVSGYESAAWAGGSGNSGRTATAYFVLDGGTVAATDVRTAVVTLCKVTGNTWVCGGTCGRSPQSNVVVTAVSGRIALASALTQVQVLTSIGSFDAGTVNIQYE